MRIFPKSLQSSLACLGAVLLLAAPPSQAQPIGFDLRMQTDLGAIDILMLDSVALETVTNFMNYVDDGDYDNSFLHRSAAYTDPAGTLYPVGTPFVVQGGGYVMTGPPGSFFSTGVTPVPTDPPVDNQFSLSNLRGTLAMAKLAGDPDSATSQWFFNMQDNSVTLDGQNGGFTVFAQVQGTGMDIVDDIAALPICPDVAPSFVCTAAYASQVPLAHITSTFDNTTLININVGRDNDADGAIDRFEDAGPNGGDANNDTTLDSAQQHVASYPVEGGEFVVVEAPAANPLQALAHMDVSFNLANPAGTYDLLTLAQDSGMVITRGFAGFDISGLAAGAATTVTVTLPAGDAPDAFFNYGPTAANPVPHWYEFNFDGTTGAQFAGNVITLHLVDGMRGDADLTNDGLISGSPGGAGVMPADLDGVADADEDAAPNGGDGNNDAIPDSQQDDVASLPDINANYVTLEAMQPGHTLHYIQSLDGSTLGLASAPALLTGNNFENGFFEVHVANVAPGGSAEVRITLPPGAVPDQYFMYGPEPGNPVDHWYLFDFDPASGTGAVINGNVVTLFLVDGGRGDADLMANGVIADPGGPATSIANANATSSGGGCSLTSDNAGLQQAGAWWLLLLLGAGYAIRRWH